MKVMMLGWEFPPFISGGLGTACYGLTKGMSELGTDIVFVLPRSVQSECAARVVLVGAGSAPGSAYRLGEFPRVLFRSINVALNPYARPQRIAHPHLQHAGQNPTKIEAYNIEEIAKLQGPGAMEHYGWDLYAEVNRYLESACDIACETEFDVVHAHDWMTYPAAVSVARLTHKPLVVHVHSTEFDRSGEHVNQWIYDIERMGMHLADRVITVSRMTRDLCITRYAVPEHKVHVVYNGIRQDHDPTPDNFSEKDEKVVLFLGRITMQKGPEYFVAAAKKVLELMDNVKFIMAGSGDMYHRIINLAAQMGIGHKVLFTGFLRGHDVDRAFRLADLFVMPSVSEPFGLAPLEALAHHVPVIISKQSGVAEILRHALKVDFWDIHEMANKIISVLRHPPLRQTLRRNGHHESHHFNWTDAARQCLQVYHSALHHVN